MLFLFLVGPFFFLNQLGRYWQYAHYTQRDNVERWRNGYGFAVDVTNQLQAATNSRFELQHHIDSTGQSGTTRQSTRSRYCNFTILQFLVVNVVGFQWLIRARWAAVAPFGPVGGICSLLLLLTDWISLSSSRISEERVFLHASLTLSRAQTAAPGADETGGAQLN